MTLWRNRLTKEQLAKLRKEQAMTTAEKNLHETADDWMRLHGVVRPDTFYQCNKCGQEYPEGWSHKCGGAVFPVSLRDQFAMAALSGMHARDTFDDGLATPAQRAHIAYIDADACLAERAKK
jgi:hypothetical protein